jgi:hypothetical protein
MKTLNSDDKVQEPKRQTPQKDDAYRAPRLVTIGTAHSLVQGGTGRYWDGVRAQSFR